MSSTVLCETQGAVPWVYATCFLSIAAAFLARMADKMEFFDFAPEVSSDSIETLLSIISASMLVIAVFAVGSMLSAYQSASNVATPRSFSLVVADDVSQNALSTFIGAFIFSIVAQVALMNEYYGNAGRFALFIITVCVFAIVIFNFIHWVDRIARLGRLGTIVEKVEKATQEALTRRLSHPVLRGVKAEGRKEGIAIYSEEVGYVQRINIAVLQSLAERMDLQIEVTSLPGAFATPDKPLAYVRVSETQEPGNINQNSFAKAFIIGKNRTFDDDPRFGLIVLSEIASRALSPAVNDPGTAIGIIGVFVRLFAACAQTKQEADAPRVDFDRVAIPEIYLGDIFDDAFNPIARDGAGVVEVVIRLQKGLGTLASLGDKKMNAAAVEQGRLVFAHAEQSLKVTEELAKLRSVSSFAISQDLGNS